MSEEKEVIATVSIGCSYCDFNSAKDGPIIVYERDTQGRLIVRCPRCRERIKHE